MTTTKSSLDLALSLIARYQHVWRYRQEIDDLLPDDVATIHRALLDLLAERDRLRAENTRLKAVVAMYESDEDERDRE